MSIYNWARSTTFNFIREKVMKFCIELATIEEQIKYLSFVLLVKKNNPPELDENLGLKPTFEEFIENEIKYRKMLIKMGNKSTACLQGGQTKEIIKINGKIHEVVRIFEAMKAAEIISMKTEVSQIGNIFFTEKIDVNSFVSRYNARKKDLISEERSTRSESLLKFLNGLIEISYKGKPEMLDKLSEHIERVRKKSYIR